VGQRPLVSWAVGTRGVGDNCAPSYTMSQGADYEAPFIAAALACQWLRTALGTALGSDQANP
jgi:hypothetical protein